MVSALSFFFNGKVWWRETGKSSLCGLSAEMPVLWMAEVTVLMCFFHLLRWFLLENLSAPAAAGAALSLAEAGGRRRGRPLALDQWEIKTKAQFFIYLTHMLLLLHGSHHSFSDFGVGLRGLCFRDSSSGWLLKPRIKRRRGALCLPLIISHHISFQHLVPWQL